MTVQTACEVLMCGPQLLPGLHSWLLRLLLQPGSSGPTSLPQLHILLLLQGQDIIAQNARGAHRVVQQGN